MVMFLLIWGWLALLGGVIVGTVFKSAAHEILAGVAFVNAAVCLAGGGIIEAIRHHEKQVLWVTKEIHSAISTSIKHPKA